MYRNEQKEGRKVSQVAQLVNGLSFIDFGYISLKHDRLQFTNAYRLQISNKYWVTVH